ncbi:MAG: hypothetical protein AAGE85_05670 [Pseudomonadota bacterium]
MQLTNWRSFVSTAARGMFPGGALLLLLAACGADKPATSAVERTAVDTDAGEAMAKDQDTEAKTYLDTVLNPPPLLPNSLERLSIDCALATVEDDPGYRTAAEVDYAQAGWERRLAADWQHFDASAEEGWLTVVDFKREPGGLAYRYLANDNSHDRLYEPWSSSKIMAFTAAVARLRGHGIGADARVGGVALADLITSINSYEPFGGADGNSNAIATYLLNLAGREYATALFHDEWLGLANDEVRFRGAYATEVFTPPDNEFVSADGKTRHTPPVFAAAADDPYYLSYRCEQCGTDGNKAMTALAQTEWLKRLASHDREPATRHPGLTTADVETVFFGKHHTDTTQPAGGMLQGISTILPRALAVTLAPERTVDPKALLDKLSDGQWRIYQKLGWGPSETRGTSELVVLAHVCLPQINGSGREFTLFGRASVPGADIDEHLVGAAGLKLEALFVKSLPALLATPE